MNTTRISDDERLITLTKQAYDKILSEIEELKQFKKSKTLHVVEKIEFKEVWNRTDYRGNYMGNGLIDYITYDIDRSSKYEWPFLVENEREPYAVLFNNIEHLVSRTKEINDDAYKVLQTKVDEVNALIKSSRQAVNDSKIEIDKMYEAVPKLLRWLLKK